MLLTIVGDPHAKPDNLDKINKLFDIVEELGNETIWLGDMLDTKEVVRSKCLNTWLDRFKGSSPKHTILVGNHDWHNLECTEHSLRPLEELTRVRVVDKAMIWPDSKIGFMPYFHDFAQFKHTLGFVGGMNIIFIHQGITGFDYGNGYIAKDEVDLATLKDFPMVISGHFHKYQHKGNLTFLGTPFSHSQGESNQDKFIAVLDTETRQLELIPTPFPKHVTVEYDLSGEPPELQTENYNRVILKGSQEQINLFDKSRWSDVKFIERPDQNGAHSSLVVSETDSNEVKFKKWAEEVKEFDEDTINLGVSIIRSIGV